MSGSAIKALSKLDELPYMRFQDPVPAVYNIKIPSALCVAERKNENLFCSCKILYRTSGKYGDTKSVDNGLLNTFQIVHSCDHIEI